ncbi:hypothetical protein [Noviherbaspirillum galbum]|uniref:Uncharacterized protein n=1 Tax=Noviherbaspirillum galbum TaxID=2709383 RepID=A0A6B3SR14_9BURK|nr:hypothetical protein [Noviherbaspirillum galbum]NEX63207.1 hypothetical protein [Noviherbaspirillum galbum]
MKNWLIAIVSLAAAGAAVAKLPPPSEEAKTAAELAKAKAAWSDKVAAYQLCKAQDKLADRYHKEKGGKKSADTPACADPGAFVPPTAAAPAAAAPAAPAAAAPAAQATAQAAPAKK